MAPLTPQTSAVVLGAPSAPKSTLDPRDTQQEPWSAPAGDSPDPAQGSLFEPADALAFELGIAPDEARALAGYQRPPREYVTAGALAVARALRHFIREHGAPNGVTPGELARHFTNLRPVEIGRAAREAVLELRAQGYALQYSGRTFHILSAPAE